jgi:hypothetical protein
MGVHGVIHIQAVGINGGDSGSDGSDFASVPGGFGFVHGVREFGQPKTGGLTACTFNGIAGYNVENGFVGHMCLLSARLVNKGWFSEELLAVFSRLKFKNNISLSMKSGAFAKPKAACTLMQLGLSLLYSCFQVASIRHLR